jgi:hypothetical protein
MNEGAVIKKYDRMRIQIQNLVLQAYPNPERKGCSAASIGEYARKVSNWEAVEGDSEYRHITHCSPCYREFLSALEDIRAKRVQPDSGGRLPRKMVKEMDKALTVFEKILNEAKASLTAKPPDRSRSENL